MAQPGSASPAAVKARSASSYQKECSSVIPRTKCACAAVLHEVGKRTLPNRRGGGPRWACSTCAAPSVVEIRHT
ncbi:MAG TPA: hypothetical protein VGO40_01750 [Longimicrobium sp.]|jgi:hypothetical protein|nr:hypothetical protein [Longimicrobium sp.]